VSISEIGDQKSGSKRAKPQKAQKTQGKVKDQIVINFVIFEYFCGQFCYGLRIPVSC
jgi:hypothetical protein